MKKIQQVDFSSILFDTLFSLVLYFSLDSFLEIQDPFHFIFYLFTTIILVHRRLGFKSADDAFGEEVQDSVLDIVFGLGYIILLEYIILMARSFEYQTAIIYFIALIALDLLRALIRRYVGQRRTKEETDIQKMEKELDNTIRVNGACLLAFIILAIVASLLSPAAFVIIFILIYMIFIFFTFKRKIIDLRIF